MGSLDPDSDFKPDFDDSGCVQDESTSMKSESNGYMKPQLLDLSDDVLLYILRHCSPRDLKALGFTCPRLCALTLDHTLWQRVDARGEPVGPARAAWFLDHALTPATTELLITGFARQADGCLGVVNKKRNDAITEKERMKQEHPQDIITADLRNNTITVTPATSATIGFPVEWNGIGHNPGPNHEGDAQENGDVTQENGVVAQENGNIGQENGNVVQENDNNADLTISVKVMAAPVCNARNDDPAPQIEGKNNQAPQIDGEVCAGDRENSELINKADKPLTSKLEASQNADDKGLDNAGADSTHDNIQDAKTSVNDAKMDTADKSADQSRSDSVKSNVTGESSNTEKSAESNNVNNNNASTSAEAGTSGASGNKPANNVAAPAPRERFRQIIWPPNRVSAPWLEDVRCSEPSPEPNTERDDNCPGPLFTFTPKMMKQLRVLCPNLTSLALDYCNLNCQKTRLCHFPRTLKKLSLKGIKCYNLPLDKCFLFKIQDYMPVLEHLDVSECEWLDPSSILGLSKIPVLKHLVLRDCCRLTEFVAYASLASRYGFKTLETLDVRGSPLGDSEVSAFSWVHSLVELHVSAAKHGERHLWPPEHTHYKDDHMPPHNELDHWEMEHEEPDFKFKSPTDQKDGESEDDQEDMMEHRTDDDMDPQWQNVRWPGHGMPESRYVIICPRRRRPENREVPPNAERENDLEREEIQRRMNLARLLSHRERNQERDDSSSSDNSQSNNETGKRKENGSGDAGDDQENREIPPNAERENYLDREEILRRTNLIRQFSCREYNQEIYDRSSSDNSQSKNKTGKRKENGSDNATDDQAEPSIKRLKEVPSSSKNSDDASTSSKYTKRGLDDSDTSDDDNDTPSKRRRHNSVNEGASTSKSASESPENTEDSSTSTRRNPQGESNDCNCEPTDNGQGVIRFRRNMNPEFVRAPNDTEPLHKILYVNVSRRLHTVYRLSMPVCTVINSDEMRSSDVVRRGRNISSIAPLFNTGTTHLDNSSLVTDIAVRAFGESDTDNVNYIQIGPNGPSHYNRRPTRTNLRVLSITGFRNITDRSLTHLMTAAPNLRVLDLSRTRVTERAVENFKSLRPECEVIYSEFIDKKKE